MPHPIPTLFLTLITSCVCLAQEAPPKTAASRPAADREPVVVSLSFSGGTVAKFVAEVRLAEPRANILVSAEAARAEVPPIELRGAGLDQAMQAVAAIASAEVPLVAREFRGDGERVYSLVVSPNPVPVAPVAAKNPIATMILSLNVFTDSARENGGAAAFSAATVLSAVETAITAEADTTGFAPVLRYHADSGLLVVRASRDQLAVAKDVLSNLERDVTRRQKAKGRVEPAAPESNAPSSK